MRLQFHSKDKSEIPRLTRAQRLNCLRVQREFIQELIDDNDLSPRDEIAFFFDSSDPTSSVDFAEDFRLAGDTYAYGVFFHNGETKWEEIEDTSNFWPECDDISEGPPQYDSDGNKINTDKESD